MKKTLVPLPACLAGIVACLICVSIPLPVMAQSCALCYTQAASAGSGIIQALRSGILILIIPPFFLSIAITLLAYRKRNRFRDSGHTGDSDSGW